MPAHKVLGKCRALPADYDHDVLDEVETLMLAGMGDAEALRQARRNVAARRERAARLRSVLKQHEARR